MISVLYFSHILNNDVAGGLFAYFFLLSLFLFTFYFLIVNEFSKLLLCLIIILQLNVHISSIQLLATTKLRNMNQYIAFFLFCNAGILF